MGVPNLASRTTIIPHRKVGILYDFTYQQATLDPLRGGAFGAIHDSQEATDALKGMFAQASSLAEFFSPAQARSSIEKSTGRTPVCQ